MLRIMHEKEPTPDNHQNPNRHRRPHGFVRRNAPYVTVGLLAAGAIVAGMYGSGYFDKDSTSKQQEYEVAPTPNMATCEEIIVSSANNGRDWEASVVARQSGTIHVTEVRVIFDSLNNKDDAEVRAKADPNLNDIWEATHSYEDPGEKLITANVYTNDSRTPLQCKPVEIATGDFDKNALGSPTP